MSNQPSSKSNLLKEDDVRLEHLATLRANGIDPYPARSERTHTLVEAKNAGTNSVVIVVGRIVAKREMGKLTFCHLKDFSGKLQFAIGEQELGKERYKFFLKNFDVGDFIQIRGSIFTTHKGEISILVRDYVILAKALLPLPEKFHGLTDIEQRYRRRYLDLLANEESMRIAQVRSKLVQALRTYFDTKGFYEVETPILQTLYGGALARPFVTHHNVLDIPLYLRIAPELYLKRLMVGGFEAVYEIAKCFRNEGIDHNHNPEFTQIEFYWAYKNYNDLMNLVEDYLPRLISAVGLPLKFNIEDKEVDFTPPYPRISMRDIIKQYAKIDIENFPDQPTLLKKAQELAVEVDRMMDRGTLIDEIYKKFARPYITNPIFMIDHPVELSPLAKRKPNDPRYVERFQLLCVGGNELCNAFSELNDPLDQEARFKEQTENREAGNEESMPYDEDFIIALKHGMPPTAGLGMGIDRLVKLLVNAQNLKEVILFPTLRPEHQSEETIGKSKETMVAHVILLNTKDIPEWSRLNAAAHLSAALAAREGKRLIHLDASTTSDGEKIPMNIQHAIIMKETSQQENLLDIKRKAEQAGLVVTCFTEEMRDSSNDLKVKEKQGLKKATEIIFLGVLIFGKKLTVESLTKSLPLFK